MMDISHFSETDQQIIEMALGYSQMDSPLDYQEMVEVIQYNMQVIHKKQVSPGEVGDMVDYLMGRPH